MRWASGPLSRIARRAAQALGLAVGLAGMAAAPDSPAQAGSAAAASAASAPASAQAPRPVRDPATRLYGYRSTEGGWAIAPTFRSASSFDNGLAFVENPDGSGGLMDIGGAIVTPDVQSAIWISEPTLTESRVSEGLLAARESGSNKVGFVDLRGRWVIRPRFADAHEFHDGLAAFRLSARGKVGFVDRQGRVVIAPRFGTNFRAPPVFSEGLAAVGLNDAWPRSNLDPPGKLGYIDRKGRWVVPAIYESGGPFQQGRAQATLKGKEVELHHPLPH
jgi:hypothetical protein